MKLVMDDFNVKLEKEHTCFAIFAMHIHSIDNNKKDVQREQEWNYPSSDTVTTYYTPPKTESIQKLEIILLLLNAVEEISKPT